MQIKTFNFFHSFCLFSFLSFKNIHKTKIQTHTHHLFLLYFLPHPQLHVHNVNVHHQSKYLSCNLLYANQNLSKKPCPTNINMNIPQTTKSFHLHVPCPTHTTINHISSTWTDIQVTFPIMIFELVFSKLDLFKAFLWQENQTKLKDDLGFVPFPLKTQLMIYFAT